MYVRNLNGDEFALQATTTHELELNGNQSISFSVLPTKVNALFIDDIAEMWEVIDDNDVVHKIIYAKKKGVGNPESKLEYDDISPDAAFLSPVQITDNGNSEPRRVLKNKRLSVDIKAVPLFFDTMDNERIYEEYNEHMTAMSAFTKIFEDMPFGFVLTDVFDAAEWEGFGAGESRLETFKRALERYKAEFRIVGNTVYLERQIGRDTSFMYRHKLNASNIIKEIDANEYWTYAKGYGDYGNEGEGDGESSDWQDAKLIREYTSPLAKILGIRHAPPIKDGRISIASRMDRGLKALVDESLKISITTDIHDLRRQGYAIAQPEVGDRVFVIDERIGLNEEVRVTDVTVTKDWRGNVLDLKLTIGSESLTKRHQSNMSTAVDRINELVEGRRKLPFSVLDDAVRNATKALQNAQTELSFGTNGILAVDKSNPNLLTLLNSAGIGISNDGGNTFRTAMTGDGIVADVITAGVLNADQVAIRGGDGSSYMYISGPFLESKGTFKRTWKGNTETHDVRMMLEKGYLRARNDSENRSLYFSDFGISTYADATGGELEAASGSILFRDHTYSTANSIMVHSYYGVVSLKSEENRIVLDANATVNLESENSSIYFRPMRDSRVGLNEFRLWVKDATSTGDTDGVISYGSPNTDYASGLRFKKSSTGRPTVYATNGNGDVGSGDFYADRFYGDLAPRSSYAYVRAERLRIVLGSDNTAYRDLQVRDIQSDSIRLNSASQDFYIGVSSNELRVTNNLLWNGGDTGYRPVRASSFPTGTSLRENKTNIEIFDDDVLSQIKTLNTYMYFVKGDTISQQKQLGLMVDETPRILHGEAGDSMEIYALSTYSIRGIQQLAFKDEEQDSRILALEEEIKQLKGAI